MIDILLNYILKSDIAEGIEKNLNEQIMNDLENKEEYFNDLLFGLYNFGNNCFINCSIQLLLRCWDCFEKISKLQNNNNEEFITWLKSCVENKSWKTIKDQKDYENLRISLNFIYEFFKFGEMVKKEKEKIRIENIKITKENAKTVHNNIVNQHKNLVEIWRLYGTQIKHDQSFFGSHQSDSYDALSFFFGCLQDVMCIFDNKQKPIQSFSFSGNCKEVLNNVKIKLSYNNDNEEKSLDNLNIQKIEDLWQKDFLKKALLDKMPLYCELFGVFRGEVFYCNKCKNFSFNSLIPCIDMLLIDDFVVNKINEKENDKRDCENCKINLTRYEFFVPIGNYLFIGNGNSAPVKANNFQMKKLESWKDNIYKFGEENDYRNIGVGMHSGSAGENSLGHYWAYIRSRFLNNLYLQCDDYYSPYDYTPVCGDTPDSHHERIYLFEKIEDK